MKRRYEIIATAFDRKGRIIGHGVNDYNRSHPLAKIYALKAGESEMKIYKHAELCAILSAGNKQVHRMLIQRVTSDGSPALAKPCRTCSCMLADFGVRIIEFTSPSGIITQHLEGDCYVCSP